MRFIGVTHRSMETSASPEPTPAWMLVHKAGNLELAAQSADCSAGWRAPSPGGSVGLSLSTEAEKGSPVAVGPRLAMISRRLSKQRALFRTSSRYHLHFVV